MSNKRWVLVLTIASIVLVATVKHVPAQPPSGMTLTIVDGGYQYPAVVISIISIGPDGSLSSLDGKELNDSDLQKLLRRVRTVGGKDMCLVRLQCSQEKDVSIETLGKGLRRIQSLASPELPTVIYVYIRELLPLDKKEGRRQEDTKK